MKLKYLSYHNLRLNCRQNNWKLRSWIDFEDQTRQDAQMVWNQTQPSRKLSRPKITKQPRKSIANEYYWLLKSLLTHRNIKYKKYWDFRGNVYEESNYDSSQPLVEMCLLPIFNKVFNALPHVHQPSLWLKCKVRWFKFAKLAKK